jgi:cell wall assembly regulator SMI1
MTHLVEKLIELNDWIEEFAPDLLEDLNEPSSSDGMAALNEVHAGRVPQDVLTVYAWHNGGQIPDPWWELNSVDEIVRIKQSHRSIPELYEQPNWWSDEWIPVGSDFDGNFLCVDLEGCFGGKPGQVLVFMHDEPERKVVAPSLGSYLEVLLQACRAGVLAYDEDEGFATDDNREAWQKFLSDHLVGYPMINKAGL